MASLVGRYIKDRLTKRATYLLPLVVGTVINCYGQFLIPYLRGVEQPLQQFLGEWESNPALVVFSIFVGYCFPFLVGLYSAVMTRFGTRDMELKAQFPDNKPDPVFCADEQGDIIFCGRTTQIFFDKRDIKTTFDLFGEQQWKEIVSDIQCHDRPSLNVSYHCNMTKKRFQTRYSKNPENGINVYLTEIFEEKHNT